MLFNSRNIKNVCKLFQELIWISKIFVDRRPLSVFQISPSSWQFWTPILNMSIEEYSQEHHRCHLDDFYIPKTAIWDFVATQRGAPWTQTWQRTRANTQTLLSASFTEPYKCVRWTERRGKRLFPVLFLHLAARILWSLFKNVIFMFLMMFMENLLFLRFLIYLYNL